MYLHLLLKHIRELIQTFGEEENKAREKIFWLKLNPNDNEFNNENGNIYQSFSVVFHFPVSLAKDHEGM